MKNQEPRTILINGARESIDDLLSKPPSVHMVPRILNILNALIMSEEFALGTREYIGEEEEETRSGN